MATTALAAHATTVTDAALPVGAAVQAGRAAISQAGNRLTVLQGTDKAIIDWQSFSIGAKAAVNFVQPSSSATALNRVVGNDPSQLLGSLTANGRIFLINAAGIMIGKDATIDVAGFTASTLKLSNDDFLANKLTFNADAGVPAAAVQNNGAIATPEGGSIYLIGAAVQNNGIIKAPGGEVLLAAGSTVQLVDTGTPGVTINVTGSAGNVTNLGQIVSAAGRIGIGAALIDNSGSLNASSVEKEGGRIFLRASKQLTTDATSQISADGTNGGNVVLYSDRQAAIGGDVSALGSAGSGGYVDTSGKTSLAVQYTPRVGPGGKWLVDPYEISIIDSGTAGGTTTEGGVITSKSGNAQISASTIVGLLSSGTNVSIVTGTGEGLGDINVNAQIYKSDTSHSATLALMASHDININAPIFDGYTPGTGVLSLMLNAGGSDSSATGAINASSPMRLGGGLQANARIFTYSGSASEMTLSGNSAINSAFNVGGYAHVTLTGGGMLTLNGAVDISSTGVLIADSGRININAGFSNLGQVALNGDATLASAADLTNAGRLSGTGTIDLGGSHTLINNGSVLPDAINGIPGTLTLSGNYRQAASGTLLTKVIRDQGGVVRAALLNVSGNVDLNGGLVLYGDFTAKSGDALQVLAYAGTRTGSFSDASSSLPTNLYTNYLLGTGQDVSVAYASGGGTSPLLYFNGSQGLDWNTAGNWTGGATPGATNDAYIDANSGFHVTHTTAANDVVNNLTIANANSLDVSNGSLSVNGATALGGALSASSAGTLTLNGALSGSGTLGISGGASVTLNAISTIGSVAQSGGTFNTNADFTAAGLALSGGTLNGNGNLLTVTQSFSQSGGAMALDRASLANMVDSGVMALGNITANSLILHADNGAIAQLTAGAIVANSLYATAYNGIVLGGGNKVAGFSARNASTGDIVFNNTSNGVSGNTLVAGAVENLGGNIAIDNTGAMVTSSLIDAPVGTVSLRTHSPLTIGVGGVGAGGSVNLSAGYTASAADNLTLNGAVASTGGSVVMYAGNNILANAAISAPNGAITGSTVTGTVIAGTGYSVNSPTPPVYAVVPAPGADPTPVVAPSAATPLVVAPPIVSSVDQNVAATQTVASGNVEAESAVSTIAAPTTLSRNSDAGQTVGGGAGTFGGSAADDSNNDSTNGSKNDSKDKGTSRPKALPVCT
jgi:filamentous hemagglutinin family protein